MSEYVLHEIPNPRGAACGKILRGLPDWFGLPQYIDTYEREIEELPTVGVYAQGDRLVGFMTLRSTSPCAREICCMAIVAEYHRQGIGRMLVAYAEQALRSDGVELLQVKTLGPSKPDHFYDQTRKFYLSCGFRPLEEFTSIWEGNPCLVMVKVLQGSEITPSRAGNFELTTRSRSKK